MINLGPNPAVELAMNIHFHWQSLTWHFSGPTSAVSSTPQATQSVSLVERRKEYSSSFGAASVARERGSNRLTKSPVVGRGTRESGGE